MSELNIRRGDIFYISKFGYQVGCEQHSGRPGIIVSCNENNNHGGTVEIVYATTRYKPELPTHVSVLSTPLESTILCEQVTTVAVERLGSYIGRCTEEEMRDIDLAIMVSLGLTAAKEDSEEADEKVKPDEEERPEELVAVRAERDTYRRLYEMLVDRLMPKAKGV